MENESDIIGTELADIVIACNGNATNLQEFLEVNMTYVFLFSGDRPSIKKSIQTYQLYDHIVSTYKDTLLPVIVTKLIPIGLKDKEVILDIEGQFFKVFDVFEHPRVTLVKIKRFWQFQK